MNSRIAVLLALACLIAPCELIAATVKKKDGQLVKGEILGQLVLRGDVKPLPAGSAHKYSVPYTFFDGKVVDAINEEGVTFVRVTTIPLIVYGYSTDTPKKDSDLLPLCARIISAHPTFEPGLTINFDIPEGRVGIVPVRWKKTSGVLLGELKRGKKPEGELKPGEPKEEAGIVPALRVATEEGEITIPVSDIVELKPWQ